MRPSLSVSIVTQAHAAILVEPSFLNELLAESIFQNPSNVTKNSCVDLGWPSILKVLSIMTRRIASFPN
jgi:hypothetical protein